MRSRASVPAEGVGAGAAAARVNLPGIAAAPSASYVRRLAWWGLAFVTPALLFLLAFQAYPLGFAVWISLHDYDLLTPPRWVGLKHYASLVSDRAFLRSLGVTVAYVVWTVVPVLGFSFALGWLVSRLDHARGMWRTLLFLPTLMPIISVALVWKLMFNQAGPLNDLLGHVGVAPVPWLTDSRVAPWALVLMSWWHATSYYMVIFLAGFLAIPRDIYAAASLDGARGWGMLRYVTLPLMRRTILLVVVLATVNGLKTFAFQQVLTTGGPANATQILTLLIYQTAFSYLDMGRASAYSMVLFGGILAFSLAQIWLLREGRGG